jgi:hypothetical protein
MEHKLFSSEVKEADEKALAVTHMISTENVDRAGDIVRADGMILDGHPVVLWAHGRDAAVGSEPIAKPLWIKSAVHKGVKGIMAKTAFFPDQLGRRLYEKVRDGFLSGWSIGFSIDRAVPINGGPGRDIKSWRLLEFSLVSVPCNADATTLEQSGIFFKILRDGEECGCAEPCKGAVKCGGHKDKRPPLRFRFVAGPPAPRKIPREELLAVARQVFKEAAEDRIKKEIRFLQGKVD